MTEKANPSVNRPAEAYKTAGAIAYGGHGSGGFVVDGANPTEISVQDGGITEGNLNTFAETSSASSLDVTIDAGEALVFGSWLAIDTSTTVTLAASTAGQTVYVGWNKNGGDDVIVGLAADFSDASGDTDERIPLWTFDTDGSGVTDTTDERTIGYSVKVGGQATFGANADVTVAYNSANDELDIDGADLTVAGVTVVDESQGYIPQASFENDDITLSTGTALTGGGGVTLGNSITINHDDTSSQGDVSAGAGAAITDIDLNPQGHVTSIGTTDFDGRFVNKSGDTMSGQLIIGSDITAANGETIWDESATHIPQSRLQNDDITINSGSDLTGGGSVNLGGSVTISHANTSNEGNGFAGNNNVINDINLDGNGHVTLIGTDSRSLNDWNVPFDFNINSAGRFGLPLRNSDPSANPGDMWYRTDLD